MSCTTDEDDAFFRQLTASDRSLLQEMIKENADASKKHSRNGALDHFIKNVNQLMDFCIRSDSDDFKRFLACGFCWKDGVFFVNSKRFRKTLGRSKSTLNFLFSQLGYEAYPLTGPDLATFKQIIPNYEDLAADMRNWVVRKNNHECCCQSRLSEGCHTDCGCGCDGKCVEDETTILPPQLSKDGKPNCPAKRLIEAPSLEEFGED